MLSGFDGGCMVAVLPKSAFALFSLVVLLCRSSGDQPHRGRNRSMVAVVFQKQMDVLCEAPHYVKSK